MSSLELVLLHALPLDGSMWAGQMDLLPGATYASTLYEFGDTLSDWTRHVLDRVQGDRLIVVGNSVGGSCALEMAAAAPERVAALVLIGAKAAHRPEPELHAQVLATLHGRGVAKAWEDHWQPLFSRTTDRQIVQNARELALRQSAAELARGVRAFHTRSSLDGVLPLLKRPVLFLSGAHDIAPGPQTTDWQARQCQNGKSIIIPDCGHYVPLEKPYVLNNVLRELIAGFHGY